MADLAANMVGGRDNKAHERHLNILPARAGHKYYVGAAATIDANGFLLPGVVAGESVRAAGVIVEDPLRDNPDKNIYLDNTAGEDGFLSGMDRVVRGVRYDRAGEYVFKFQGAPVAGQNAFMVDSDTVDPNATLEGIVLGEFTRPFRDGWFVDVRANPPVSTIVPISTYEISRHVVDVTMAASWWVVANEAGTLERINLTTDSAFLANSTALSFKLGGVAVVGGDITLPATGGQGAVYGTAPTGANLVAINQAIEIVSDGGGAALPFDGTFTFTIRL